MLAVATYEAVGVATGGLGWIHLRDRANPAHAFLVISFTMVLPALLIGQLLATVVGETDRSHVAMAHHCGDRGGLRLRARVHRTR